MVIPNLSYESCQDTAKQYADFAENGNFRKFKAVCTEQQ
ncbi:hypothetical protein PQC38_gp014 [Aeromonas phage BUCT695]|nr:hypothetical protein PQC38_gp014 [Aeromonas phage BUCT695]UIW10490.1 hypothetical protein [Aeromonas phage BUCT695]